ncbi:unnamed protein product, partial [Didymodactylos carnosus]
MNTAIGKTSSTEQIWNEPVCRLRGLPYNTSKEDLIRFFNGLQIADNGIHISSSKPAGEAFVCFKSMDQAQRGIDCNRNHLGHRYIEVFKSSYAEARQSIMNDTQNFVNRQNGQDQTMRSNGVQKDYMMDPGSQGNFSSMRKGLPLMQQHAYNFHANNNNMNMNYMGNPMASKRTMSTSYTVKMRGVPFDAVEKDIYEFFRPVTPIRVEIEKNRGKQTGLCFAEFGSREEAEEAMTFHKKYMGQRYVELIPLYDNNIKVNHFYKILIIIYGCSITSVDMNVGIAQGERNPNSSWLNSRGVWLTYVILIFVLHFILLSIPYITTPIAWTLTTSIHNICSFYLFHIVKGAPWETSDQGLARRFTFWEQIDDGVQWTGTRKFVQIIPIVL